MAAEIDREKVEALSKLFLQSIRAHYLASPPNSAKVYEILNALACAAGIVIAGCDPDQDRVRGFFNEALNTQVTGAIEQLNRRNQ